MWKEKLGWRLGLSRTLAILLGITAPLLDTYWRWNTWQEDPLSILDDYILGGLLLYGAWRVSKDVSAGQKFLVAGWGICTRSGLCERGFPTPTGPRKRFRSGRDTQ